MLLQKSLRHWCIIIKTLFKVLSIIIIRCCKNFGHAFECLLSTRVFVKKTSTLYRAGFLDSALVFVCWKNYLAFLMQFLPSKFRIKFSQLEYCKDFYTTFQNLINVDIQILLVLWNLLIFRCNTYLIQFNRNLAGFLGQFFNHFSVIWLWSMICWI